MLNDPSTDDRGPSQASLKDLVTFPVGILNEHTLIFPLLLGNPFTLLITPLITLLICTNAVRKAMSMPTTSSAAEAQRFAAVLRRGRHWRNSCESLRRKARMGRQKLDAS
jgi:hypothetical protein